jgi:hypothetical protein
MTRTSPLQSRADLREPDTYDPIADAWASYAAALAAGKVPAPLYPEPPAAESQTIMTTRGNDA